MMDNGNTSQTPRKVCIATGTRADWGLLSPIAKALDGRPDTILQVIATNMHLSERYGMTVNEIEADGITVSARVKMDTHNADSDISKVKGMAQCMAGCADALERLAPDVMVILGDRYEMLAVASAAAMMHIPVIHIAGGEISEGAIDDSIRHAITKLSALHLTATEQYRRRVIQLGEEPRRVINTGAIGVYNIVHEKLMTQQELEQSIGFEITAPTLLVTYHPATLDETGSGLRCKAMLDALDRFPQCRIIMTYPNNDAGSQAIIDLITGYADRHKDRVLLVKSLGRLRYLSALRCVRAVVGNSSSGIVEVPSMGIPTVDIGIRQRGRIAAKSVIHCGDSTDEIYRAVSYALSPFGQSLAASASNPYYKPSTLQSITEAIAQTPLHTLRTKRFYDIDQA